MWERARLIGVDINKQGDIRTFNLAGAKAAIAATTYRVRLGDCQLWFHRRGRNYGGLRWQRLGRGGKPMPRERVVLRKRISVSCASAD